MTQFEQLDTILEGQHGMLQTSEVVKRGIPKSIFIIRLSAKGTNGVMKPYLWLSLFKFL